MNRSGLELEPQLILSKSEAPPTFGSNFKFLKQFLSKHPGRFLKTLKKDLQICATVEPSRNTANVRTWIFKTYFSACLRSGITYWHSTPAFLRDTLLNVWTNHELQKFANPSWKILEISEEFCHDIGRLNFFLNGRQKSMELSKIKTSILFQSWPIHEHIKITGKSILVRQSLLVPIPRIPVSPAMAPHAWSASKWMQQ